MADDMSIPKITFPDPRTRVPTILVVDDEPLIRATLVDFLQECGFKTLGAGSADEAKQLIESYALVIDLVISDIMMPGNLDGFSLAQWIRQTRPGLPVILCSADSKKAKVANDICGGAPFFAKPYDLDHVVAQVRQELGARKL